MSDNVLGLRKVFSPDGWASSSKIEETLTTCLNRKRFIEQHGLEAGQAMLEVFTSRLTSFKTEGSPVYYIEKDVGLNLLDTDMPEDMSIGDVKFPHGSFILVPHRDLLGTDILSCTFMLINFIPMEDGSHSLFMLSSFGVSLAVHKHKFVSFKPVPSYDPVSCFNLPLSGYSNRRFSPDHIGVADKLAKSDLEVQMMYPKYARVAFGSIFLLTQYKELIHGGEIEKRIRNKSGGKIEVYTPRWIGRISENKQRPHPGAVTGTHASPVTHWRRGHWRRQRVGAGRTEGRMVWLKPQLVNAAKVNE